MPSQTFTTTGSWTAPTGVTQVYAECWAAGGNNDTTQGDGGAGGGAYSGGLVDCTPGNLYTIIIEGVGTLQGFNGDTINVAADYGRNPAGTTGAAGGLASNGTGTIKTSGGSGGDGDGANNGGGGGGSGSPLINGTNGQSGAAGGLGGAGQGAGGQGETLTRVLTNGIAPGGGAGGGSTSGLGAVGMVILTWNVTNTFAGIPTVPNNTAYNTRTGVTSSIYLKPDWVNGQKQNRNVAALTWTHIALFPCGVDIRDSYQPNSTESDGDTIKVPDNSGTSFVAVFVERVDIGLPTAHKRVYLDRRTVTWPTNNL